MKDRGPALQTYTGRAFYPLNPRPEDFDPLDVAVSLSREFRFNNVTEYSVAEHCYHASFIAADGYKFAALLHDVAEFVLRDIGSPIKNTSYFMEYKLLESRITRAAFEAFRAPIARCYQPEVSRVDSLLCGWEAHHLMRTDTEAWKVHPPSQEWLKCSYTSDYVPECWPSAVAAKKWLSRFNYLKHIEGETNVNGIAA